MVLQQAGIMLFIVVGATAAICVAIISFLWNLLDQLSRQQGLSMQSRRSGRQNCLTLSRHSVHCRYSVLSMHSGPEVCKGPMV